jgi:hypothetical protein
VGVVASSTFSTLVVRGADRIAARVGARYEAGPAVPPPGTSTAAPDVIPGLDPCADAVIPAPTIGFVVSAGLAGEVYGGKPAMSAIEILAVIGIIGYVIFKQVRGEALRGKRAVLLPAILTVIGFTDLHASNGAHLQRDDIICIVIGAAGSVLIGLAFGAVTRLENRGGYLWAQLPVWGLWLWGAMFAWRGVSYVLADSMHAHVAASSSTLLFGLGLNRLAQAAVVVPRAMSMGVPFAPEKDGSSFLSGLFDQGGAQPVRNTHTNSNAYDVRDREEYEQGYGRDTRYDEGRQNGQHDYDRRDTRYDDGRQNGQHDYDRSDDRDRDRDRHHDRDLDRSRDRHHDRRQARRDRRYGDRW